MTGRRAAGVVAAWILAAVAMADDGPGGATPRPADAPREAAPAGVETPAPAPGPAVGTREKELEYLRDRSRRAFAEHRMEEAELYSQLARRVEEDIARRAEETAGAQGRETPRKARWEFATLLTHFDNHLHLDDGAGFSFRLLPPLYQNAFHLTWRRWDTETSQPGSSHGVDVNEYLIGFSFERRRDQTEWFLRPGIGVVHFADTSPSDSGPLASLELEVSHPINKTLSWSLFGLGDALRTRANQDGTRTNFNVSIGVALEGRF